MIRNNSFNVDFGVEITEDTVKESGYTYNYNNAKNKDWKGQMPGISVFVRNPLNGKVYHSYSTYAAGLSELNIMFNFLDILPEGRAEKDVDNKEMWWVKHKEEYTKL